MLLRPRTRHCGILVRSSPLFVGFKFATITRGAKVMLGAPAEVHQVAAANAASRAATAVAKARRSRAGSGVTLAVAANTVTA